MSSTIINTNVSAINSHRSMKVVGEMTSKASEKLSSGLRINRAADDAAGLAISEKMRSQIRGLEQASRNSQDGISLIQTAEGALQETEDMLQRMRELVVQGANDSNMQSDRDKIALELNELIDEIDATAAKTEFNKKKLIDGSWSNEKLYFQVGANNSQSIEFNIEQMNSKFLGITKDKVSDVVMGKTVVNAVPTLIVNGADVEIDASLKGAPAFDDKVGVYEFANGAKLTVNEDGSIALSGEMYKYDSGGGTTTLIDSNKLATITSIADLEAELGATGKLVFDSGGGSDIEAEITVSGGVLTITSAAASGALATQYEAVLDGNTDTGSVSLSKDMANWSDVTDVSAGGSSLTWSADATGYTKYSFSFSDSDKITFIDKNGNDISSLIESDRLYTQDELAGLGLAEVRGSAGVSIGFTAAGIVDDNEIYETVSFTPANAVGSSVGKEISKLTDVLDNAIELVSSQRAKLGAYQNRMEHTIKNLDTSSENLSAAESRIRDTDMAKEMMNFTKSNVLSQAAMSMLAQANQAPNNVLSLLR